MFSTFFLLFSVSLSPMSNRATFAYLTRLQREIGFRFLPRDFRTMMKKCLNVYMTSLEAEFVRFKVKLVHLYFQDLLVKLILLVLILQISLLSEVDIFDYRIQKETS